MLNLFPLTVPLIRSPWLQIFLAVSGVIAFCVYSRSWKDGAHLIYDIPASLAVFAFIAQLLLELATAMSWFWVARGVALMAMCFVTLGREFQGWPISGHLSCVLAVALIQLGDARLSMCERLAYMVPLPIVLAIRWHVFDRGDHAQTYWAIAFAVAAALPSVLIARGELFR